MAGTFGDIYAGTNIQNDNEMVAIKIEKSDGKKFVLKTEAIILKKLQGDFSR